MLRRSLFLGLWALVATPALATTIRAVPEPQLTREADAVVFGRIITTRVIVPEKGPVSTEADLQIYDRVKGPAVGELIRVRVPGGQVGGLVQQVSGAPTLLPGQMWVGFLSRAEGGFYRPWGLGYGLIPARMVEGTIYVGRDTYDANVITEPNTSVEDMLRIPPTPLQAYMERLRGHLPPHVVDPTPGEGGLK